MFHLHKFWRSVAIATTLIMARTFGRYLHSGWNGIHNFAKYEWRGEVWYFPTSPAEHKD